ncbi:MAG TPA: cation-translocating P-type ATPase, partial [Candidatus Polarisedimenticolia bacterium]|nr:cation-translocating P-type ATPase [Candidatus Polarisedimenticolia bacterium]
RGYRFTWLGFVALADPLRAGVHAAVAECRRAGVRVVVLTGDFPGTGLAIARQAGIATDGGAITGEQVASMDAAALAQVVGRVNVFARIRPEQKLRLVSALQERGEIVAMTGDGVNDAPALKAADIGVAMGKRGTDVARESASLVLLEDDFASIVLAIRLGRRIYENIRNAMRYILAVHVPIAGMSFLPLLFDWPGFLYPVHIVFLEFVIDPACTIVFEAERSDAGSMRRPPRPPGKPMFDLRMLGVSLLLGTSLLLTVALAYGWAVRNGLETERAHSIGFAAIVFGNLAMIQVTRSRDRAFREAWRRPSPALGWITVGTLAALGVAIYVPAVAAIFRFAPLRPGHLALAAAAGVTGVLWYEIYKRARPRALGAPDRERA